MPASPPASSTAQYGPPQSAGSRRDLLSNLAAGLRAAVFLAPRPGQWRPFADQIVLLALLDVLLALAFAFARAGLDGEFQWTALPRALLPAPLALMAGWFVARRSGWSGALAVVATAALALLTWFDLAAHLVNALDGAGLLDAVPESVDLMLIVFGWWVVATGVAAARVAGRTRRARIADFGWTAAVLALPVWFIPFLPLWSVVDGGDEDPDAYAGSREEVIYAQPELLHRAEMRLARQRPGVEDLYFIGAAGYAGEDVFLNEMSLAAELMRTRFDAEGRIVMLSNNAKTVRTLPVASATSLARALRAVAATMDVEEDVLFLFLTSHGGSDHTLSMEFWPLQLEGLTPDMLKRMLDEAGVRWRVIAVSACYAGGFVEPLKDERTLIVTAADAHNTSFGCGTESTLTYFGRAFFDEALRGTHSFVTAYERARVAIAARERAQDFRPSNPQLFVGDAIGRKLERMARRLPPDREDVLTDACGREHAAGSLPCDPAPTRAN